jgi:hypothetical protein
MHFGYQIIPNNYSFGPFPALECLWCVTSCLQGIHRYIVIPTDAPGCEWLLPPAVERCDAKLCIFDNEQIALQV